MRFFTICAIAALGFGAFITPGLAHHSTNNIYDEERVVEITGVVKQWRFVNPHPYLILEVTGPDGQTNEWNVSFGGSAVTHLSRRGYTGDTFTPGDVVVIEGNPARADGAYGILIQGDPTREDGSKLP